ncbi:MAG: hypothetical protein HY928_15125 [Elusimicrobia bacterium]|nr:hypothetical protein [Elusimicrobiota bacterium]
MTPPKGKPVREENLLVDISQGGKRAAPEIPTLGKKKEEKTGGGVPVAGGASSPGGGGFLARWFGVGARGGSFSSGGAATVARSGIGAAGKLGFGPMLVNFLASNLGAVLLTGAITGGAVYTLYSLGMNSMADAPAKSSVFPTGEKGGGGGDGAEGRVDASGLSFFQSANQGMAFQQPGAGAGAAEAAAEDKPADAPAADGGPAAEPQGEVQQGSGPQIADALAKALPKPKMIAARGGAGGGLGAGNGLAGGSGLSGGMMKKFDPKGDDMKKAATPMRRDSSAKLTARRMSPVNRAKSGSMNQLRFANGQSRKALGATSGEAQSFQAAEAFNTAPLGQGAKDISAGAGAGDDGAGVGPSADDGGPIGRTGEEPAPDTGKKEDKSPYSQALMMAMALLMTASTIITIIGILAIIKKIPIIGIIAEMWQKILYGAAIAMAAAAAAVGAMVASQYGQKDQGMIVTIGGAITSAAATAALMSPRPEAAWLAVLGGIAGMASSIGALLVPMMGGGAGAGAGGSSTGKK